MRGIKLFRAALADFRKTHDQLDQALKEMARHHQQNDLQLAREHGIAATLIESATKAYHRTIDNLNARRDQAKRKHAATHAVLTAHQESARRIRDRVKEFLA